MKWQIILIFCRTGIYRLSLIGILSMIINFDPVYSADQIKGNPQLQQAIGDAYMYFFIYGSLIGIVGGSVLGYISFVLFNLNSINYPHAIMPGRMSFSASRTILQMSVLGALFGIVVMVVFSQIQINLVVFKNSPGPAIVAVFMYALFTLAILPASMKKVAKKVLKNNHSHY